MEGAKESGTTVVGIKGKDYVVLAADKQSTYGTVKYGKRTRKIAPIAGYMALATSGLVGDIQILTRFLENRVRSLEIELGERPSPKSIARYLSLLLNSARIFPFFVGLLLGGYKEEPYLAAIDMYGGIEDSENFTAEGSGMPYALAVMESDYREDMKVEEAVELAVKAVEASRKLDVFSGGREPGIDVAIIDRRGFTELSPEKVLRLKRALKR